MEIDNEVGPRLAKSIMKPTALLRKSILKAGLAAAKSIMKPTALIRKSILKAGLAAENQFSAEDKYCNPRCSDQQKTCHWNLINETGSGRHPSGPANKALVGNTPP